jgi:dTDP-glucose 4,6-dehydratase/UDP-glucose 4-epimerase
LKYLVSGGAGFIGSALVRRLVADGHEVRVLDDMSRGRPRRLAGVPCEVIEGDIRDPDAVTAAVHGCDTVAHLAFIQGTARFYAEPRQVLDVALRGMLNVLAACEVTGCRDLLLVSSSEAYQSAPVLPAPETVPCSVPDVLNPRYSYGGGKVACEIMASAWQRAGVLDRAMIARPHNIYAGDMGSEHVIPDFCRRMSRLDREHPDGIIPFPIQGTGLETRSFCHVSDCVDQLMLLLGHAGAGAGIWHVGNEDERTIADVAHAVAACWDREIKIVPGTLQKGSPQRRLPDTAKIRALGYPGPKVSFAEGVAETAAWYKAHAA